MSLVLPLDSQEPAVLPRLLRRLPQAQTQVLLAFNALLERRHKLDGPSFQAQLTALVQSGFRDQQDLRDWLRANSPRSEIHCAKAFSEAKRQAELWLEEGRWVASLLGRLPPNERAVPCPRVLFGKGKFDVTRKWAAFFNSRKPKLVSPHAEWLQTLRTLLEFLPFQGLGLASSLGTITYDLVSVEAERKGARLLLLVPRLLEAVGRIRDDSSVVLGSAPDMTLSCLTGAADCPKATRMVCRDRLLALISDLHCPLEVRPGGNLWHILERQPEKSARLRLHLKPEEADSLTVTNWDTASSLLKRRPGIAQRNPASARKASAESSTLRHVHQPLNVDAISWGDYLYHYTRSCPGPWPGQSYRSYLESLLDGDPCAEHTALATLGRILVEGRIRAGSNIVRGNQGVVSWTSRPPQELYAIRHWNAALIRWTFEPYGLAVKRSVLRQMGASPVIYAGSAVYGKLSRQNRFRFQLHEPPRRSWKHEREWRLPKDVELSGLAPDDAFAFLPTLGEARQLAEGAAAVLPLVALRWEP